MAEHAAPSVPQGGHGPAGDSESFVVRVKAMDGSSYDVTVTKEMSVVQLKAVLEELTQLPPDAMRLIFQGKVLTPDKLVRDFPLEDGSVVHLVRRPLQAEASSSAPSSPSPAPAPPPVFARTRQFVAQLERDLRIATPTELPPDSEPERLLNSLVERTGRLTGRVHDYVNPMLARGHARTIQRLGLLLTSLAADLSPEIASQTVTVQIHAGAMPPSSQPTPQMNRLNLGNLFGQVMQSMQNMPSGSDPQGNQGGAGPDLNALLGSVSSMLSSMNVQTPSSASQTQASSAFVSSSSSSSSSPPSSSSTVPSQAPQLNLSALMGQIMQGLQNAPQPPPPQQTAPSTTSNTLSSENASNIDNREMKKVDEEDDMDTLLDDALDELGDADVRIDRHATSLPPQWREVIVRDMQLQRDMPPQRPLSDAYLQGDFNDAERAAKRRRIDLGAQESLQRRLESALENTRVTSIDGAVT